MRVAYHRHIRTERLLRHAWPPMRFSAKERALGGGLSMTRYLMLTAAAVLAGTGAAAGTFVNAVSLGSGCELNLYTSGKGIFAVAYAAACGGNGGEGTGQGLVRKTPQGKRLDLTYSDN